jgi:hypothetical protein
MKMMYKGIEFDNELGYNEALKSSVNELIEYVKINDGKVSIDYIFDSPIYPANKELIDEFTDENNFIHEEFISYLVARSEDILDRDWEYNIIFKEKITWYEE